MIIAFTTLCILLLLVGVFFIFNGFGLMDMGSHEGPEYFHFIEIGKGQAWLGLVVFIVAYYGIVLLHS